MQLTTAECHLHAWLCAVQTAYYVICRPSAKSRDLVHKSTKNFKMVTAEQEANAGPF